MRMAVFLTYHPHELKGWKKDEEGNAIMITRDNELIPSPATLDLKSPDGSAVNMRAAGFPANLFPEYNLEQAKTDTTTSNNSEPSQTDYKSYKPKNTQAQTGVKSF